MRQLLHLMLSAFKFYRRKKGGRWYYIWDDEGGSGIAGQIPYWSQTPPSDLQDVLKEENY